MAFNRTVILSVLAVINCVYFLIRFSSDVSNVPTLLNLLVVIPEEINNRKIHIATNRRQKLTEIMTKNCRIVLELLVASLGHWPDNMEIKTRVGAYM